MTEYMGIAHFPDDWEEKDEDIWTYATTFGDKYEVITRPDGTLTVKEKDVISSN